MKRFSIRETGYDMDEVNRFVDIVIKKLDSLNRENVLLKEENQELKLKRSSLDEEKLTNAIVAIQETSDRMKQLAREESKLIIEDAKRNANAIVHEALVNAEKTENEANLLRKNVKVYKNRIKSLIEAQLEIAEDIDKIEL